MAVEAVDVVDDLAAAVDAEVHVDIRHGHALGVQETLEKETVFDRVYVGDVQAVGHDRARGAAAPGADRDALAFGVVDEILYDQKVIDKAHAADDVELIVKLRAHLLAPGEALGKALVAELPEIGKAVALAFGQVEARQVVVAEFKVKLAALRDFDGVFHGLGQCGEECAHFFLAFEIELLRLKAQAVCLVHGVAGLDAQQHVLRRGVFLFEIVRVVCHGQRDTGLAA